MFWPPCCGTLVGEVMKGAGTVSTVLSVFRGRLWGESLLIFIFFQVRLWSWSSSSGLTHNSDMWTVNTTHCLLFTPLSCLKSFSFEILCHFDAEIKVAWKCQTKGKIKSVFLCLCVVTTGRPVCCRALLHYINDCRRGDEKVWWRKKRESWAELHVVQVVSFTLIAAEHFVLLFLSVS